MSQPHGNAKHSSTSGQNAKDEQLEAARDYQDGTELSTQQGLRVDHTDDSVTVGERGPTLMEDFHAREKITHFDHERMPERVVHARGAGAYGYFQPYDDSLSDYTAAKFLTDPNEVTPVFTRFSTVAGSRGSADTVRDVRGFATKFYTRQGNYDLVGNNFPVFFIQDGIKFPDFVHAVKPEPRAEIPQAQSAHDTLWDFVSLQPETLHTIMWLMSDRALPRSYRMMQGFGVHTFRFVNNRGQGTFVKFHWTPRLGTHSLVWDETQKVAGKDPDFNRKDLWYAIEQGHYPEWELGVQLVNESDEFSFDFDLLDATKIIPEEEVPVRPVGKLVLNRNPDNFFAETEQIAFHTANVVPGIDFTNDPLLQGRNFSYLDTQLNRFGSANFSQLPVNRPVAETHNNQRDGFMQQAVHTSPTSYFKNSIGGGCPALSESAADTFKHYTQKVEGEKIRKRAEAFQDHYSQAALFWNSMTAVEAEHIVAAYRFELGHVLDKDIRARVVEQLGHVNSELARRVAAGVGVEAPSGNVSASDKASPALSQVTDGAGLGITSRKVAVLVADGVDAVGTRTLLNGLTERGAAPELLAPTDGTVRTSDGEDLPVDGAINTVASVLYDAVAVPCGPESVETLSGDGYAVHFITEAYKHAKPVAAFGSGVHLLSTANVRQQFASDVSPTTDQGVVTTTAARDDLGDEFVVALAAEIARHRAWERVTDMIAA